ncbi:hypothetical protein Vadar_026831 [Vaccinium darrowii]|uniref:Uncharacterized protein n=1 Tax=Vaccinium darrowii TaxID=229202 RepID=A0ACB7YYU4_9ERIC|nr:hypothetical protein Vadar_026831 [Vaccinium darrowii]
MQVQRSSIAAKNLSRQIIRYYWKPAESEHCDVFISHRRIDTNKNVAALLHDRLSWLNLRPFLDSRSMKPGDKLFEKIDSAICNCKVGIAVISPNYCKSYNCLHELSMIMECNKKVIPIYVDVKLSDLRVLDNGSCRKKELLRYREAIEEAKNTLGLTFESSNGDWSELLENTSDAVFQKLLEIEEESLAMPELQKKYLNYY